MAQPPDSGSKTHGSTTQASHNEKKQSFKNKLLDKDLIDDLLATGCGCGKACLKKFSFKNILQWRELLASLCRPDQDLFLWNMAKDGLPGQWVFLGQPVCRPAMCSLTMSGRRLKQFRTAHHKGLLQPPQDMRRVPYPRKSPAKEDVLEYLRWMHNSMAEAMPNMPNDVVDSTDLEYGPTEDHHTVLAAYESTLLTLERSASSMAQAVVGSYDDHLETRYLPAGTWYEAWLMYRVERQSRGVKPATFMTFWATWKYDFQKLQHRDKNSFGKCNQCTKYKEVIKQCIQADSLARWINFYGAHLLSQYKDRLCYYHEREQSKLTAKGLLQGSASTLTIIIDAMDQAKFCIPRHVPGSKSLKDALRPRMHVVGVIAHGWFRAGYLVEPTISKDANVFIEILA